MQNTTVSLLVEGSPWVSHQMLHLLPFGMVVLGERNLATLYKE
jgi:hypothetical protein